MFDVSPELLQEGDNILGGFACENNGEFFAAVTECLTASLYVRQVNRDHSQDIVPHIVSEPVIDLLEMVDIHHGDGVFTAQFQE